MIQRNDLTDIGDADYRNRQGEYIVCSDCEYSFGGTRGDYWQMAMDNVFDCPQCKSQNLALVRDKTTQETVKE